MSAQMTIRRYISPFFQKFGKDVANDFTETVFQDQFEQRSGLTVHTPPPSTAGGMLGAFAGTYFNAHLRRRMGPAPAVFHNFVVNSYLTQIQYYYHPIQCYSLLGQCGVSKDQAPLVHQLIVQNRVQNVGGSVLRHLRSSLRKSNSGSLY